MDQIWMAIGNLVNTGNKMKITPRAVTFHPISKPLYLLVHPAKAMAHYMSTLLKRYH